MYGEIRGLEQEPYSSQLRIYDKNGNELPLIKDSGTIEYYDRDGVKKLYVYALADNLSAPEEGDTFTAVLTYINKDDPTNTVYGQKWTYSWSVNHTTDDLKIEGTE